MSGWTTCGAPCQVTGLGHVHFSIELAIEPETQKTLYFGAAVFGQMRKEDLKEVAPLAIVVGLSCFLPCLLSGLRTSAAPAAHATFFHHEVGSVGVYDRWRVTGIGGV